MIAERKEQLLLVSSLSLPPSLPSSLHLHLLKTPWFKRSHPPVLHLRPIIGGPGIGVPCREAPSGWGFPASPTSEPWAPPPHQAADSSQGTCPSMIWPWGFCQAIEYKETMFHYTKKSFKNVFFTELILFSILFFSLLIPFFVIISHLRQNDFTREVG